MRRRDVVRSQSVKRSWRGTRKKGSGKLERLNLEAIRAAGLYRYKYGVGRRDQRRTLVDKELSNSDASGWMKVYGCLPMNIGKGL
jgi:hypothetical protein